jgi:Family of unknown function (DUF5317)
VPVLAVIVLAVAIGYAFGGRLRNFERIRVHWPALAFLALVPQVLPAREIGVVSASSVGAAMLIGSYLLMLVFIAVNRWIPAARLMALGLFLNLLVVGLNGGMPVAPGAVEAAGGSTQAVIETGGGKHHLSTDDTLLPILGDTIPIPKPAGIVLSIGDVLLYLGIAWFVIQVMRGRSRENPRPLAVWFPSYRGSHAPSHWRLPARNRADDREGGESSGTGP